MPEAPPAILREIRELHRRRAPMNLSAMKRRCPELLTEIYSLKPFVGWKNALMAAGISYDEINVELLEYVTCPICGKDFATLGQHLLAVHDTCAEEVREEYPDRLFSSEAMRAGFSRMENGRLPHWEPVWTPEYVLDRIAEYHAKGVFANGRGLLEAEGALHRHVAGHYGSWRTALEHVSLRFEDVSALPNKGKLTTVEEIVEAIRIRHRGNLPLNAQALQKQGDSLTCRLYEQSFRLFASWDKALEAAGLNPAEHRLHRINPYPTAEAVLDGIRRRHEKGLSLLGKNLCRPPNPDESLRDKGVVFFGSWYDAVRAAGFERPVPIRPSKSRYPDADDVIAGILERLRQGLSLSTKDIGSYGENSDGALYHRAMKFFGNWKDALKAAGLDPDAHVTTRISPYRRPEAVLKEIRRRRRKRLSLKSNHLRDKGTGDHPLYNKALEHFGSWSEALRQAGVDPKITARTHAFPNARAVISGIRDRARCGLPLGVKALERGSHMNNPLLYAAKKFFGSWHAAMEAASIPIPSPSRQRKPLHKE